MLRALMNSAVALVPINGAHFYVLRSEQGVLHDISVNCHHLTMHLPSRRGLVARFTVKRFRRIEFGFGLQQGIERSGHSVGQGDGSLFGLLALNDVPQPVVTGLTAPASADL